MGKSYTLFLEVMQLLSQACKLLHRNKKIFLFIAFATMFPFSILIQTKIYYFDFSLFTNLFSNGYPLFITDHTNPPNMKHVVHIKEGSQLNVPVEMIYFCLMTLVSVLSMAATIYASAMSYIEKDLTVKELLLKIKTVWIGSVITWFSFTLLNTGFLILILPLLVQLVIARESFMILALGYVLLLPAIYVNLYLVLVWMVSLVISVLEDYQGIQALGKAAKLVNERKMTGIFPTFLLLLGILFCGIVYILTLALGQRLLTAYVTLTLATVLKILSVMVYTVFYFERKQSHGEDVEDEDGKEFTGVSTVPLVALVQP